MPERPVGQCSVLRCSGPVHRFVNVSPPSTLRRDAALCYTHSEGWDREERWLWTDPRNDVGGAAYMRMGTDLPPLLTSWEGTSATSSVPNSTMVSLTLTNADGTTDEVEFEWDPEAAKNIEFLNGDSSTS